MEHHPAVGVARPVGDLDRWVLFFLSRVYCFLINGATLVPYRCSQHPFISCGLEARAGISPYGAGHAGELLGVLLEGIARIVRGRRVE